MKIILLAALASAAACSRPPEYTLYRSPTGYSVEIPAGWRVDPDPVPGRKPATTSFFAGPAVLSVGRFVRRRADVPGDAKAFKDYQEGFLKPTLKLFGDDAPTPARKGYSRGLAIRTADAYFLIECRADKDKQELCRAPLDRAAKTFALN
ncbi:MAG: hypothetical protein ACHQ51_11180 [Elusimicrobiota bacterium]